MSNIELRFEHPWLLLLLIPAIILTLVPYFKLPRRRRKTVQRLVPTVLHCVMAVLLTLVLAGTAFVRTTDNQAVILLLDYSDSTRTVRQSMDAHATQLQKLIRKNAPVSIVAFGGDCVYDAIGLSKLTPANVSATDLSSALEYAASKLPDDKVGRIIVLSDGRQTDGDASLTAQYLRSQGVRIDGIWFDTSTKTEEVQISEFTVPSTTFAGTDLTFTTEIESNTNSTITLSLFDGETQVDTLSMSVSGGSKVLTMKAPNVTAGTHHYRLELNASDDTISQNNQAFSCVEVAKAPHLLIISGINTDSKPLEAALANCAEVTAVSAAKPPRKLSELCDYDGVVLLNVHTDDLPKHFGEILDQYVSEHGRSLIAVGGDETFMYGGMRDTEYEDMMPVDFSLSRTSDDDSVALMLVIDCSLSMSQQSTYMSLAKQGAIKCVQGMTENDYVGIISFNQDAAVEAELAKNTDDHKDKLNRIISGLTTSQGTYYTDALALAHQELLKSDAPIRHILFVSDGGPADSTYKELIPGIAADGIAMSTIALSYDSSILSDMASNCSGTYYHIQEATDLPDIMLSLTQHVSVNSFMTGTFAPTVVADSELAASLPASLPMLDGYLGTTMKRGAQCHITVGEDHPLLASWTWGKGKVTCFTSGLDTTWGSNWINDPALISSLVKHAAPQTHSDSSLYLNATPGGQSVAFTVHSAADTDSVMDLSFDGTTTKLACIAPGVFEGSIPTGSLGSYPIAITQTDKSGELLDSLTAVLNVPVRAEYDAYSDNGQATMKSICLQGGGMLAASPDALANIQAEEISAVSDFRIPFGILFAIMLLADIGIRKLRWKDVKNIWFTLTRRK